ncbi:hypothetical protein L6274_02705 [Candidatus Parcubacteria bacterium]|nr:hypothetical protein [Candidatus Parcubacteria bacterium]
MRLIIHIHFVEIGMKTSDDTQMLAEIFLFFLGYRPIVLKNFKISFSLIKEGYKEFSPLRYENDLFIRGNKVQYNYIN